MLPHASDTAEELDLQAVALDRVSGLTADEQSRAPAALERIASLLGLDTIKEALAMKHRPLAWLLLNRAPWTRRELIRLADQLDGVRHADAFLSFCDRLRDARRYGEAVSVLHVAAPFAKRGFALGFEPRVTGRTSPARPDIRIRKSALGLDAYIEVTALHESLHTQRATETMMGLHWPPYLGPAGTVLHAGAVYRTLAPPRIASLRARLMEAATLAAETGELVEVVEPDTLEFAFAPDGVRERLEAWAAPRDLQPGVVAGPQVNFDESARIAAAVRNKSAQLPRDGTGIVAVWEGRLTLRDAALAAKAAFELQEEVSRLPHVAAAIVICSSHEGAGESRSRRLGQHVLVQSEPYPQCTERVLIVRNEYAAHRTAEVICEEVMRAFGAGG